MKKMIWCLGLLMLTSCQEELYTDDAKEYVTKQAVYLDTDEPIFKYSLKHNQTTEVLVPVRAVVPLKTDADVSISVADQTSLDKYNKQNETEFTLLPTSMYEVADAIRIEKGRILGKISLKINNIDFSEKEVYALPIQITSQSPASVKGRDTAILIIERELEPIVTKVFRFNGSGAERSDAFGGKEVSVQQWTFEAMVKRSAYNANNKSIGGTKTADRNPLNEIFTRFGDVTINPNQLQIKTGASQIDIPSEKFAAQPNVWYALAFTYDGKTTRVFVNGEEVASREIRDGAYTLNGMWIGGSNEYIREVRFWSRAVPAKELKENYWKVLNPKKAEGLLLYYPLNGKKYNHETGEITEDETKIWDWSKTGAHLNKPGGGAGYPSNELHTFTPPKKD